MYVQIGQDEVPATAQQELMARASSLCASLRSQAVDQGFGWPWCI